MHVRKITKMRTLSLILLAGLTMLLLGCGLSTPTQINEPTPEIGETTTPLPSTGGAPPSLAVTGVVADSATYVSRRGLLD